MTTTNVYNSAGRAIDVTDAAGHELLTSYDGDGLIQGVSQVGGGAVATYTYGSGISNGVPISVTDNLSGVSEGFTYVPMGQSGAGGVASVTESNSTNQTDSYTCSYTYSGPSLRATATYATPFGTNRWAYRDYRAIGDGASGSRRMAFETLNKLDNSGNLTDEEINYSYDAAGRLHDTAFAQSHNSAPADGKLGYNTHPADTRARESFSYDAQGRVFSVNYAWETWSNSSDGQTSSLSSTTPIYEADYTYDAVLALMNAARFRYWTNGTVSSDRTETYGYDANRDWLTSANYNDGLPNASVSWGYDDAGNRVSDSSNPGNWSYDNLNRIQSSPQGSYTHDILGNRMTGPGTTMSWDLLNRMTGLSNTNGNFNYMYRADGLRVMKATSAATSWTFYDATMPMQEVDVTGSANVVSDNGVGARGLELMIRADVNGSATNFSLFDGHGNMAATLSRASGDSYTLANQRTYDAWGGVRSGSTSGDPQGRYCANLGHKQDDESNLIYMRARYYEPSSGRFLSQDRGTGGWNQFVYCDDKPNMRVDADGNYDIPYLADLLAGGLAALLAIWCYAEDFELVVRGVYLASTAVCVGALAILALGLLTAGAYVLFATGAGAAVNAAIKKAQAMNESDLLALVNSLKVKGGPSGAVAAETLEMAYYMSVVMSDEC